MTIFKKNDYVAWKWAGGMGHGKVQSVHTERTQIASKGKQVVRNGAPDNPAIIIKDHNGTPVIKLATELQKAKETQDDEDDDDY